MPSLFWATLRSVRLLLALGVDKTFTIQTQALGQNLTKWSRYCLLKGFSLRKLVTQTASGSRRIIYRSACQNEAGY